MDDIGEPIEASPEFFSCTAKAPVTLPKAEVSENSTNLLACSSRFGYAVVASSVTLSVLKLADIQEAKSSITNLDLSDQGVQSVLSIQFIMGDVILLVHAESKGAEVFLLQFPALIAGNVQMLTTPVAAITFGAFSESNPTVTPSSQLIATLTSAVHVYNVSTTSCEPTVKINVPGPLSLAFAPSDTLLAVGTQRGCVYIHFTSDASLAATIVEVESGWIPFAIHFVSENSVLVTYSKDDNIRYVMWTLEVSGKTVSVASHFPLGELCLPSPDVDSDQLPNVVFNNITSWNMCIISSSISTEAEIVAKVENEWQVWKLDESKSVYLPINEDEDDTFPLGSAIDYTDVNPIEPEDPSSGMIQPMPRFLVLTSEFKILPYSLTDARAGAKCDLVRPPSAVPQVSELERPEGQIIFPDFSREHESSKQPGSQNIRSSSSTYQGAQIKENSSLSTAGTSSFSRNGDIFGFRELSKDVRTIAQASNDDKRTENTHDGVKAWTDSTSISKASFAVHSRDSSSLEVSHRPHSTSRPSAPKISPNGTLSQASVMEKSFLTHDSSSRTGSREPAHLSSMLKVPPSETFSETGAFLSQFYTETKKEDDQDQRSSTTYMGRLGPNAKTVNMFPEQPKQLERKPESVSLQPSLEQALIIAKSGEGVDVIRSILCEMSEELTTNRKAGAVLTKELKSQSYELLGGLDAMRNALGEMMDSTMVRFHRESVLRKEVSETLKHILRISRAYETLALELQVEDTTGLSRSLKPEDMAMDEQISCKEAEVVKSLTSIEGRLAEEVAPKKYKDSADVVREIFSSLSLQGIRIRRVLELLNSLSQRLEEHDQGGRQSSLGLSLARLEQLSLEESKSTRTLKADGDQCSTTGIPQNITDSKAVPVHSSTFTDEGHELFPPNIDALLRKLAMSGGRELICPLAQQLSVDNASAQKDSISRRELQKDRNSAGYDKTGESQMADVRKLLEAVSPSSRLQAADTGAFTASSILKQTTPLTYDQNMKSLLDRKAGHSAESVKVPPKLSDSTLSFETSVQKNFRQQMKIEDYLVPPQELVETPFSGKELSSSIERRGPSSAFSSRSESMKPNRESKLGSNSLCNDDPLDKTKSRAELMSSLFSSGELQDHQRVQNVPTEHSTLTIPRTSSNSSEIPNSKGQIEEEHSITSRAAPAVQKGSSQDSHLSASRNNGIGIPFAGLPPDDFDGKEDSLETKTPLTSLSLKPSFASLPPDDFDANEDSLKAKTPLTNLPPKPPFASMPPDEFDAKEDSLKTKAPFTSLPPKSPFASLPPDDFGATEKHSKKTEVQFASLPPDEDEAPLDTSRDTPAVEDINLEAEEGKSMTPKTIANSGKDSVVHAAVVSDSARTESTSVGADMSPFGSALKPRSQTIQSDFPTSQSDPSAEQSKHDSNNSFFGTMSSAAVNTVDSSPFGQISNQNEGKGNDVFGMSSLLAATAENLMSSGFQTVPSASNQAGTSVFGAAMQMNRPNEVNRGGDGGSPIAATESDDSEDENLRQGMDTSVGVSNTSGSHGISSQSPAGGSLFGQAFSSAFGTPTSGTQVFGQPQSQVGSAFGTPQLKTSPGSFGTPGTNAIGGNSGLNNSPFGVSPSFGVASRIGESPVFGAPSAIGRPPAFGNASPIGAQSSPFGMPSARFGESSFGSQSSQSTSMLGFGASSGGTGGASPFGALATGTGFGESASSASGFAALAANSNGLVFGNGGGPPAFTSAAFTQRRA
ncbi:Nuclear pore complex protein [Gracilaria domingensis]|nr:Nuclear pore complex protein [Gracilaria domingensis]